MTRYFFELCKSDTAIPDGVGSLCKDEASAIRYAWKMLAQCLAEPAQIMPWQHAEMLIKRDDGAEVARVAMTTEVETRNPATENLLSRLKVSEATLSRPCDVPRISAEGR